MALTRDPAKLPADLRDRVEIVIAGLGDPGAAAAFAGADAVVAVTHIKFAPRVLDAMNAAGIKRAVFMSSTRRFTRFPEETAKQVMDGEKAVRNSWTDSTIIRASMIYGGPEDNNLEHLVSLMRRWPAWAPFPVPGNGRMLWQPVFTHDVVSALVAALRRPEVTAKKEYNVAGPTGVALADILRAVWRGIGRPSGPMLVPVPLFAARAAARVLGFVSRKPRLKVDQIQRLAEDKVFDISEARRDLGFDPVSFAEGLRRKLEGTA